MMPMRYSGLRRSPAWPAASSGLLLALLAALAGCGLPFLSAGPRARLDPPPGRYDHGVWVEPDPEPGESFYWTDDPNAAFDDFEPFHGVHIASDRSFRYYAVGADNLRSPIIEARYSVTDESAPTVANPFIGRGDPGYYSYWVGWSARPEERVEEDGTELPQDPIDDATDGWHLEYAVYSSAKPDIETLADAEAGGTVEMSWQPYWWIRDRTGQWDSRVGASPHEGLAAVRYTAGRSGEPRYFNVFVRDQAGKTTPYGMRRLWSLPALSIYFGYSAANDEIALNDAVEGSDPTLWSPEATSFTNTVTATLGRLNADRLDDLVLVTEPILDVYSYSWYPATGNGSYGTATSTFLHQDGSVALTPKAVALEIVDFSGDGRNDIVLTDSYGRIFVYDASGTKIVDGAAAGADAWLQADADWLKAGDINGDDRPDIVTASKTSGDIDIMLNQNGTSLSAPVTQSWAAPTGISDIELADLDRDGYDDLVVAVRVPAVGDTNIEIFWGTATGELVPEPSESTFWSDTDDTTNVAVGDIVGPEGGEPDGFPEIFAGNGGGIVSRVYENNGDRTFRWIADTGGTDASTDSLIADLNGDGWPDVLEDFETVAPIAWRNDSGTGVSAFGPMGTAATFAIAIGQIR